MKLKLLVAVLLIIGTSALSQNDYESGYIIQTNGQRLDCLIKNEDWKGSPTTFNYKLLENGEVKIGNTSNIKEFGSGENFKYIVETLLVEQSSNNVGSLTDNRTPILKEETLFLKVLIEGESSLYFTMKDNNNRFFYKMKEGEIEQLIYKRFVTFNREIAENNGYKQQLATDFVCSTMQIESFNKLEYKQAKLINLFEKYNVCVNSEAIVYENKDFKYGFNLSVRPGVTFGSVYISAPGNEKLNFESKTGFRIGLEAEYILPFNSGKWSLFMEPSYKSFKSETEKAINQGFPTMQNTTLITVDYKSIELPIGGRYYMFLNKESAFFINAAVIIDLSTLDSSISSSNENSYNLDFHTDATFAYGVGFKFKNTYSIEARYQSPRNLIDYVNVTAPYKSFSLIAGYNFL